VTLGLSYSISSSRAKISLRLESRMVRMDSFGGMVNPRTVRVELPESLERVNDLPAALAFSNLVALRLETSEEERSVAGTIFGAAT
jgi:hypothetical protein